MRGEAPAAARVRAGELEGEAAGSIHEACERAGESGASLWVGMRPQQRIAKPP